jgi:superfamily I DNA/RNA helicase
MKNSQYQDALIEAHLRRMPFTVQATAGSGKSFSAGLLADARPNEKHMFMMFSNTLYQEALSKNASRKNVAVAKIYATGSHAMNAENRGVSFLPMESVEATRKYLQWFFNQPQLKRVKNEKARESAAWVLSKAFDIMRLTLTDMSDIAAVEETMVDYDLDVPKLFDLQECQMLWLAAAEYGREQVKKGVRDFTDMVWIPNVEDYSLRLDCDALIVDEAQDLSEAQFQLIARINAAQRVYFGDRYQSIFGFGGASTRAMDNARSITDGNCLPLSISYRVPQAAVRLAKEISLEMEAWDGHPNHNNPDCVQHVMEDEMRPLLRPGDVILSRRKAPMIRLCLELMKEGYSVTIKGDDIAKRMRGDLMEMKIQQKWNDSTQGFHVTLSQYRRRLEAGIMSRPFINVQRAIQALDDRMECLKYFFDQIKPMTYSDFITQLGSTFDRKGTDIVMMTGHKAKGLEWDRVFVLEYNKLPLTWNGQSEEQSLQERYVKFVMLTRTKSQMFLVSSEEDGDD